MVLYFVDCYYDKIINENTQQISKTPIREEYCVKNTSIFKSDREHFYHEQK